MSSWGERKNLHSHNKYFQSVDDVARADVGTWDIEA